MDNNNIIISRFNCETSLSIITSQLSNPKTLPKTLTNIMENLLKQHCKTSQAIINTELFETLIKNHHNLLYEKESIISTEYYFQGKYTVQLNQPFSKKYSLIVNVHYQSDFHVVIFSQISIIEQYKREQKGILNQKDSIIIETTPNNIIYLLRNISKFREASSIFCDRLKGKYDNLEEGDVFVIGYERKEKTKYFELKVISINNKRNNHFEISFEARGIKDNGNSNEKLEDIPKQNISLTVSWIHNNGPVIVHFIHHFPEGVIVDYFKNLSLCKNLILKQLKDYLEKTNQ